VITRYALPRFVELGQPLTLDLDIYSDADAQQTTTAATLTVYLGTEELLSGVAATPGAPTTYALLGATTTDRAPSDDYLEVWDVTIGGAPHRFQREGYLVRRAYHPTITDRDLTDRHSELLAFSSKLGGYQRFRDEANVEVQMALLEKGRRPWLIFDRAAIRRLHLYQTFALVFNDFMSVVGDGKWERLRDDYREKYERALDTVSFRYDEGQSGTIDTASRQPSASSVFATAGPRYRAGYSTP